MDTPDQTAPAPNERKLRRNRILFFTVFGVSAAAYGAFVFHKFVLLTKAPEEMPIADVTNVSTADFSTMGSKMSDAEFVRAADALDRVLMEKVRAKYPPLKANKRQPRAVWHQEVERLEKYHAEVDDDSVYSYDTLERRELERLKRIKEDKPRL